MSDEPINSAADINVSARIVLIDKSGHQQVLMKLMPVGIPCTLFVFPQDGGIVSDFPSQGFEFDNFR